MNLEQYLEQEPRARERKNKNRCLGNLMILKYGVDIPKDKMADMVGEILNQDRKWRKILEDRPDLRGKDYGEKEELENLKLIELGYGNQKEEQTKSIYSEEKVVATLF